MVCYEIEQKILCECKQRPHGIQKSIRERADYVYNVHVGIKANIDMVHCEKFAIIHQLWRKILGITNKLSHNLSYTPVGLHRVYTNYLVSFPGLNALDNSERLEVLGFILEVYMYMYVHVCVIQLICVLYTCMLVLRAEYKHEHINKVN